MTTRYVMYAGYISSRHKFPPPSKTSSRTTYITYHHPKSSTFELFSPPTRVRLLPFTRDRDGFCEEAYNPGVHYVPGRVDVLIVRIKTV
jgi:hypothetical protein